MKIISMAILLFLTHWCLGQADSIQEPPARVNFLEELIRPDSISEGVVHLTGDTRILPMMQLETFVNRREHLFNGYRIQILSASSENSNLDTLRSYCTRLEEEYPGIPAYLQYINLDFKIRVGNYRSKIEAIPDLKKIRKKYPSSYIVKTPIYLRELLPQKETEATEEENTENTAP